MSYDTPKFQHDCSRCLFIRHETVDGQPYDFYLCNQLDKFPTLIARFSDEGRDYLTGWDSLPAKAKLEDAYSNPLAYAYIEAFLLGYVDEDDEGKPIITETAREYFAGKPLPELTQVYTFRLGEKAPT